MNMRGDVGGDDVGDDVGEVSGDIEFELGDSNSMLSVISIVFYRVCPMHETISNSVLVAHPKGPLSKHDT
jgi:hypothetical protein